MDWVACASKSFLLLFYFLVSLFPIFFSPSYLCHIFLRIIFERFQARYQAVAFSISDSIWGVGTHIELTAYGKWRYWAKSGLSYFSSRSIQDSKYHIFTHFRFSPKLVRVEGWKREA